MVELSQKYSSLLNINDFLMRLWIRLVGFFSQVDIFNIAGLFKRTLNNKMVASRGPLNHVSSRGFEYNIPVWTFSEFVNYLTAIGNTGRGNMGTSNGAEIIFLFQRLCPRSR